MARVLGCLGGSGWTAMALASHQQQAAAGTWADSLSWLDHSLRSGNICVGAGLGCEAHIRVSYCIEHVDE